MDCMCGRDKPVLIFEKILCLRTKTASYMVAVIEIIVTAIFMGLRIKKDVTNKSYLYGYAYDNYDEFRENMTNLPESEYPEPMYSTAVLHAILGMFPAFVHFGITSILLYGLTKDNFSLIRIWLWMRLVNTIDMTTKALSTLHYANLEDLHVFIIILILLVALVVVRSHVYQNKPRRESIIQREEEAKENGSQNTQGLGE